MIKKQTEKEYKKLCRENNKSLRLANREIKEMMKGK